MPDRIRARLAELQRTNRLRSLRALEGPQGPHVTVSGRRVVSFSSNDTLGLANHPALRAAAGEALDGFGHGAGAARLLGGNFSIADRLEEALADWLGGESALLFNSGYHANIGVIPCLATADRRLYSDAANHASIIDGARLARADTVVYPHWTPPLQDIVPGDIVVTESVFSMEGDRLPDGWLATAADAGALTIVDEAHAIGWAGQAGGGLARDAFLRVGTFGKALGGYGAFVVGSAETIALLRSAARSFIFTTGLPAPVLAANLAAVSLAQSREASDLRERLDANCRRFAASAHPRLRGRGPIFTLRLGSEDRVLQAAAALENAGFLVGAVRPPTVAPGQCLLRVVVTAAHENSDIDGLCDAMASMNVAE